MRRILGFRLDKVLGTSKSLDSYESGPSLASRICKIELQVNFSCYHFRKIQYLFHLKVDALDIKVDRLCQLASSLLEHNTAQSPSSPAEPAVANPPQTVTRFRAHRRRQYLRSRVVRRSSIRSIISARSSVQRNSTQGTIPMDNSGESLISLYCLFQDNLNSSTTDLV